MDLFAILNFKLKLKLNKIQVQSLDQPLALNSWPKLSFKISTKPNFSLIILAKQQSQSLEQNSYSFKILIKLQPQIFPNFSYLLLTAHDGEWYFHKSVTNRQTQAVTNNTLIKEEIFSLFMLSCFRKYLYIVKDVCPNQKQILPGNFPAKSWGKHSGKHLKGKK